MTILTHDFATPRGWRGPHLQTIRSRVVRRRWCLDDLGDRRDLLVALSDGTPDRVMVTLHTPRDRPPATHLDAVVLVHGMGGSAESHYVSATATGLLRAGYRVARVDLRGAGRSLEHSTNLYHGGRSDDIRAVLGTLALALSVRRGPTGDDSGGLALVGFSLGGNVTLKTLGEPLRGIPLRAGVAVSTPLDLAVGAEHLHHVLFGAYERALLQGLRKAALADPVALSDLERRLVRRVQRIEEFDDVITARRNGWRDAAEYYEVNSSIRFLPGIRTPTLIIHALDDPMVPAGPYLSVDWRALERDGFVQRAITPHGGHVGFHERDSTLPWYVGRITSFLDRLGSATSAPTSVPVTRPPR
jgi:predicted alpha/beta-fold hydrolase